MARPTYSREEVDEIVARALRRQFAAGDRISRKELLQIADEIGLSPEEVDVAAADVSTVKVARAQVAEGRSFFFRHLRLFSAFIVVILLLDRFTTIFAPGFYWPLLGWGALLVAHGAHALRAAAPAAAAGQPMPQRAYATRARVTSDISVTAGRDTPEEEDMEPASRGATGGAAL